MGFNFYKKGTQPLQFRKCFSSQKSRKQVHEKFNTCSSASKGIIHQDPGRYVSSWTDKAFFALLGNTDKRQKHSERGQKIRTKIFIRTSSEQGSKRHEYVNGGKNARGAANSGIAEEGANNSHKSLQERVCQQHFSERKERWAVSASSKFKIIESVCSISLFQDGRLQSSEGITIKGRLYGEVRPTGCIF